MRGNSLYLAGLAVCSLAHQSVAFTITTLHQGVVFPSTQLNARGINTCGQEEGKNLGDDDWNSEMVARRAFVKNLASVVAIGASSVAAITGSPEEAQAAASSSYVPGTIWQTGKQPKVPGQKPKDKNDTSGTRKDGNFLRSIADCKSQCENSTGPDGLSRSKEECLSDCQDICCKTYEQCSFAIVPRI